MGLMDQLSQPMQSKCMVPSRLRIGFPRLIPSSQQWGIVVGVTLSAAPATSIWGNINVALVMLVIIIMMVWVYVPHLSTPVPQSRDDIVTPIIPWYASRPWHKSRSDFGHRHCLLGSCPPGSHWSVFQTQSPLHQPLPCPCSQIHISSLVDLNGSPKKKKLIEKSKGQKVAQYLRAVCAAFRSVLTTTHHCLIVTWIQNSLNLLENQCDSQKLIKKGSSWLVAGLS